MTNSETGQLLNSYTDSCNSATGELTEYYCGGGNAGQLAIACSAGTTCSNGACVQTA